VEAKMIQKMTTEQIDELASLPTTIPCPTCKGASQESDTAPHCDTCDDFGWFPNPAHPDNHEG